MGWRGRRSEKGASEVGERGGRLGVEGREVEERAVKGCYGVVGEREGGGGGRERAVITSWLAVLSLGLDLIHGSQTWSYYGLPN